jgi:hypothetical protein
LPGWTEVSFPGPIRGQAHRQDDQVIHLVDGELYKRAASGVLQRCVPIPQGRELLRDMHVGMCGHHAVSHTLVGNAFR